MEAKTIGNYGGPYEDAYAVENPETDLDSDNGNRLLEDVAQMTRTSNKAQVSFATVAAAAPQSITAASHNSQWGSGVSERPTIDKTATGEYTVTYASSYNDGLAVSETVSFLYPTHIGARIDNITDDVFARVRSISANIVKVLVESPKGTLSDTGDVSGNPITVDLALR